MEKVAALRAVLVGISTIPAVVEVAPVGKFE